MSEEKLPVLEPSGIGEVIKYGMCPRYTKLRFDEETQEQVQEERDWKTAFQPLSVLLSKTGNDFEDELYSVMKPQAHTVIDSWKGYSDESEGDEYAKEANDETIRTAIEEAAERPEGSAPTLLLQAPFAGNIAKFYVAGDADVVAIWPGEGESVTVRVFDIKSSWEEQTYHHIQTSCYTILLKDIVTETPVDCTVEGGIIYKETDVETLSPDSLPSFTLGTREDDVFRLLQSDGFFESVLTTPLEEIEYQLNEAATNSSYAETYFVDSIESKDISLLGLTRGEQKAFREVGVETIEEMAELTDQPDDPKPWKYEDPPVKPDKQEVVQELDENFGVGQRIPILAQKAQAMLSKLNPSHPSAWSNSWTPWLQGVGNPSIPDDDPPKWKDVDFERGSMVRVYLHIQKDFVNDAIVMASGRVSCTNYDGTPFTFSSMVDDIPESETAVKEQEEELLADFTDDIFESIQMISQLAGNPQSAPVHFYLYTPLEKTALEEATERHSEAQTSIRAFRDLMGLRDGIDQSMVSVLKPEVEQSFALPYPNTGLLPVRDTVSPPPWGEDSATLPHSGWTYTREDGTEINLQKAFHHELFNYRVPYQQTRNSVTLDLGNNERHNDGYYPAIPRDGSQIPLEYIWGCKEINRFTPDWTETPQYKGIINLYRYIDTQNTTRITKEDLQALGKKFAHAVHHIERSMDERDVNITKKNLNIGEIDTFTLGDSSLQRAATEYLDLEYNASRQDALSHYRLPLKQRMLTGKSVPFRVTSAKVEDGLLYAEGELIYDEFDIANPTRIAESCRYAGSEEDGSGGKNVVATPLVDTPTGKEIDISTHKIIHSTPLSVESFDANTGTIKIKAFPNGGSSNDEYVTWHKGFTTDPQEKANSDFPLFLFEDGAEFFIDPNPDDLTAHRSKVALDHLQENPLYNRITQILSEADSNPTTTLFEKADISPFNKWLLNDRSLQPNPEQKSFINEIDSSISLLQGPPGTGKTSGSMALAILARIYAAHTIESPLRGLVTGSSNKSVDEMLEDVSEALQEYNTSDATGDELQDTLLVRLTDSEPEDSHSNVQYVNYHEDENALEEIWNRVYNEGERQTSLTEHNTSNRPHIIVFSTPSRTYGLADKIPPNERSDAHEAYENSFDMFDFLAVDEASMMPLPELFMTSAFITDDAQVLIAGDQRQMPPVQKYNWEDETRRTITENIPFLSTLNYFRFLRGEPIDVLEDNDDVISPEATIPIERLQKTYRCHTDVAKFLKQWVYDKDNINYHSDQTESITPPTEGTLPSQKAVKPPSAISVILHDDDKSRQSNLVEAYISQALSETVPQEEDVGMVTPHNAQKGLLNSMCDNRVQVDTVERFQGGERDAMIVSATVSDPDYIDAEEDFIMNPNRLNVAISRMKKKLIVVAPKTLFEMIPEDVEMYNNSTIWKGLYKEVCQNKNQVWEGSLKEFTDNETAPQNTLEIYEK